MGPIRGGVLYEKLIVVAVAVASPTALVLALYLASAHGQSPLFIAVSHVATITSFTAPVAMLALEQLVFRFGQVDAAGVRVPAMPALRVAGSVALSVACAAGYLGFHGLAECLPAVIALILSQALCLWLSSVFRLTGQTSTAIALMGAWRYPILIWVLGERAGFGGMNLFAASSATGLAIIFMWGRLTLRGRVTTFAPSSEAVKLGSSFGLVVGTFVMAALATFERLAASFSGMAGSEFANFVLFVNMAILPAGVLSSVLAFISSADQKKAATGRPPSRRIIGAYASVGAAGALAWLVLLSLTSRQVQFDFVMATLAALLVAARMAYAPLSGHVSAFGSISGQLRANVISAGGLAVGALVVLTTESAVEVLTITLALWCARAWLVRTYACS